MWFHLEVSQTVAHCIPSIFLKRVLALWWCFPVHHRSIQACFALKGVFFTFRTFSKNCLAFPVRSYWSSALHSFSNQLFLSLRISHFAISYILCLFDKVNIVFRWTSEFFLFYEVNLVFMCELVNFVYLVRLILSLGEPVNFVYLIKSILSLGEPVNFFW